MQNSPTFSKDAGYILVYVDDLDAISCLKDLGLS